MTITLEQYVAGHTERGECKCGRCADSKPDPTGHTVDTIFFKVAQKGECDRAEFIRLTEEHWLHNDVECIPLDGKEHSFIELGAWLGDQGLALQYMALGTQLGVFELLTPRTVLGDLDEETTMRLAMSGLVTVRAKKWALVSDATCR